MIRLALHHLFRFLDRREGRAADAAYTALHWVLYWALTIRSNYFTDDPRDRSRFGRPW